MSGIKRIQQRVSTDTQDTNRGDRKEIWINDKEQMFFTCVATGHDDDTHLDDYYQYTYQVGNRWNFVLKDERLDLSCVPPEVRAGHKFALWIYVHEIIHVEKKVDTWEERETADGRKVFVDTVNDFRILPLSFGINDVNWNKLVNIYSEWGTLNKGVLRLSRAGAGRKTTYDITPTLRETVIPEDRQNEIKELDNIKEYFYEQTATSLSMASSSESGTSDDLDLGF